MSSYLHRLPTPCLRKQLPRGQPDRGDNYILSKNNPCSGEEMFPKHALHGACRVCKKQGVAASLQRRLHQLSSGSSPRPPGQFPPPAFWWPDCYSLAGSKAREALSRRAPDSAAFTRIAHNSFLAAYLRLLVTPQFLTIPFSSVAENPIGSKPAMTVLGKI